MAEPDLPTRAHAILKANCYRCHGQDGAIEGGLNYVLDLKALVARRKVVPNDPAKSKIYKRLISANDPMPPADEKPRPSAEEIAVLKAWIEAGAPELPTAPGPREAVTEADVARLIHADLEALDERARRFTRYFTLTHLYNAGLAEDQLQTYRHGLAKLVNSLSWEPDVVAPKAIDPARTILRIDLRNYRWGSDVWERILEAYTFGILQPTVDARAAAALSDCDLPYVRADWFVFAASRPPLYHQVLLLPKTERLLERDLKIDVTANITDGRVARAAFNSSGVSRSNRLIERHRTGYGAYWKSYDFAGNEGRQNLFAYPLGPGDGETSFRHDGGEIIFNLPNGLQAYLLVDAAGKRIDEGPTKIVSVKSKPNPTVINGVSCMFCHARGVIEKADQVRDHIAKNPEGFSADDQKTVRALYPPEADFKALLKTDAERFRKAVEATGGKLGGTEPVAALSERFEAELDLTSAAAEAGVDPAVFVQGLERSAELSRRLGSLKVAGGTVQRSVFVSAFEEVVRTYRLGLSLSAFNRALAERTEAIRLTPKNGRAHAERADLLYDKGDFEQAIVDYSDAIRLGLREADVYRGRGMAHASRGAYAEAIADYDAALRIEPNHTETLHNRALAYGKQGDTKRALADLNEVLRQEPENARALSDRGFVHAEARELDKALADYRAAAELSPRSPSVHQRLAWLLATATNDKLRDGKKALEHAESACALTNRKDALCLQTLAAAQAECGRFEEAVSVMKTALQMASEKQKAEWRPRLERYEEKKPYRE